jgi:hypothetical protein
MRQSRMMSLVEAVTNVAVGLVVAVATQIAVFPVLGLQASLGQNLKLALVFTGVSIARSYALRRLFETMRTWVEFPLRVPRPCQKGPRAGFSSTKLRSITRGKADD